MHTKGVYQNQNLTYSASDEYNYPNSRQFLRYRAFRASNGACEKKLGLD